jgi:thioredoxin-related protein
MWGLKEVTDFDGEETNEKNLARKWGSIFTPTIYFYPDTWEKMKGKNGKDAAVAVMPGAFGKGTFLALFEWIQKKRYETGEHFQKYVNDRYWKSRGGRPANEVLK